MPDAQPQYINDNRNVENLNGPEFPSDDALDAADGKTTVLSRAVSKNASDEKEQNYNAQYTI
jgi:hypothetical protein